MDKKYAMILHNGFEEIEAIAVIDLLRRAQIDLDVYSLGKPDVTGRSGIVVVNQLVFNKKKDININIYNGLLIPGGPGVMKLINNNELIDLIKDFNKENKLLFAICAAPLLFHLAGILDNRKFTCFPGTASEIKSGTRLNDKVVVDGNIITSQSAGTAIDAALKLIEVIISADKANEIRKQIIY